ncbi:MAG: hypothetical protein WBC70_08220 [Candidatus Aminicenantales bacterium]
MSAADAAVELEVERDEPADTLSGQMNLNPAGIMIRVEKRDLLADEL